MEKRQPGLRIGLALGGGMARGLAHLGVMQVLLERGLPIHCVAGTSSGSMAGAFLAAGLDPWTMERMARRMRWRQLVRVRLRREALLDTAGLDQFIVRNIGDLNFSELKLPFAAVATDLLTGDEVVLRTGRVAAAVRASCALPGIFMPERVDGRMLVDGVLVNNVPASVCRQLGADYVIGVDVARGEGLPRPPRHLVDVLMCSLAIMQRPQTAHCLNAADAVIQPDLSVFGALELERVAEMVAAGRAAAAAAVPGIEADLAAHAAATLNTRDAAPDVLRAEDPAAVCQEAILSG